MIKFTVLGEEIWKDVSGYEGIYKVSNHGNVMSMKRPGTKGGLLKPQIVTGYQRVLLKMNNVPKKFFVHRLVANAFLERIPEKNFVNHIDGNKENNHISNLEWCNRSENQKHAYKKGLQKVNVKEAHAVRHEQTKVKIKQFTMDGEYLKTFDSIREAAQSIGLKDGTHISAVAKGKRKSCGGYLWKY